jgi:hypothetical protein
MRSMFGRISFASILCCVLSGSAMTEGNSATPPRGSIAIVPIGKVDPGLLSSVCGVVAETFQRACRVAPSVAVFEGAFDERRRQYSAATILRSIVPPEGVERALGVVDVDLFVPELNFVFGLAEGDRPRGDRAASAPRRRSWRSSRFESLPAAGHEGSGARAGAHLRSRPLPESPLRDGILELAPRHRCQESRVLPDLS